MLRFGHLERLLGGYFRINRPLIVPNPAGANKFLRIYYGKVNAFLAAKEETEAEQTDTST